MEPLSEYLNQTVQLDITNENKTSDNIYHTYNLADITNVTPIDDVYLSSEYLQLRNRLICPMKLVDLEQCATSIDVVYWKLKTLNNIYGHLKNPSRLVGQEYNNLSSLEQCLLYHEILRQMKLCITYNPVFDKPCTYFDKLYGYIKAYLSDTIIITENGHQITFIYPK